MMPTVDINSPAQAGQSQGKGGFLGTGLPMIVVLGGVGAVIGLVVFMSRKQGEGDDSESTLMPNTAIMLGSLQQGILNLQGQVSTGNADLSSQMAGVGENLGLQIDTQTGQIQQGFSDINTNMTGYYNTLTGQQDALASAIASLASRNDSSFQSIINQLLGIKQDVGTVQAGIGGVINTQNQLSSRVDGLGNQLTGVSNQVSGVRSQVSGVGSDVNALGRFLGWQFYQIPNRYSAYIPGQGPGQYGGSPIGML